MKLRRIACGLALLLYTMSSQGYSFQFNNTTNQSVKARIQLVGIAEPYYEKDLPAFGSASINFVTDWSNLFSEYSRKAGMCINTMQLDFGQGWQDIPLRDVAASNRDAIITASKSFSTTPYSIETQFPSLTRIRPKGISGICQGIRFDIVQSTEGFSALLTFL